MIVHTIHLKTRADLSRAFARLTGAELVEDCLVEPEQLRIRFVASGSAERLLEQIYRGGGLTWHSRSRLRERRP
jgi:hypothetical protein